MVRYAFNTTGARMRSLGFVSTRSLTTGRELNCKARVSHLLEQAQAAGPKIYKTVKEKACDNNDLRRTQLIWLAKYSLGKEHVAHKASLHELPWSTQTAGKQEKKKVAPVDVTVWPHLWLVIDLDVGD